MKGKKLDIRDWFCIGLLLAAVILFAASMSSGDTPRNEVREASRIENTVSRRMSELDRYMSIALSADKKTWMTQFELPDDMVVYRYIEDSLQFWYNQFPVSNDDIGTKVLFQRLTRPSSGVSSPLAEVKEEADFVNYGSKWYLVKSATLGSRKVIAGLEIKDDLDDDSPNGVNKNLKLRSSCTVVPLSESLGSPVFLDGKPVFKIIGNAATGLSSFRGSATFIWLALACFILSALLFLRGRRDLKSLWIVLAGLTAVLAAVYLWGDRMDDRANLFSPSTYADGQFFNSLGAVMVTSLLIFLGICCMFFTRNAFYKRILGMKDPKAGLARHAAFILLLMAGIVLYVHLVLKSIIRNSDICLELYRLNDLNQFSLIVYLMLTALLMTIPLLVQMLMPALKSLFGIKFEVFSAKSRAATAILFAAYLVLTAGMLGFRKERDKMDVLANRLSMDRDIGLELNLRQMEDKIAADGFIASFSRIQNSNYLILNRIAETYFYGFAQDYDIMVEMFSRENMDEHEVAYLTGVASSGVPVAEGSRFSYRRDQSGHNMYTGIFSYYNQGSGVTLMMMTVAPKSNREDKGYASILGVSSPGSVVLPSRYSYAKYLSDNLISFKGSYAYPTIVSPDLKAELQGAPDGVFRMNGYTHFVNNVADDEIILVSRPRNEGFNYFVAFLFLTLSFYLLLSTLTLVKKRRKSGESNYYKSRINAAMLIALVMTMISLATVSVLFVNKRNNANMRSAMIDKINSLQTLIQARCRFFNDYTEFNTQEFTNILEDISNTMKSDLTLYTTGGKEFKTTSPEVFESMMLGYRMNQRAFENITYRSRRYYIGRERIAGKKVYSLYAPLFNAQGRTIAIMSSPYTDDNYDFKAEAVLHSVTVITVFMILLLLALFVTERAVDKMFKPLSEIGQKMNEADINNLEYIIYEREDEVSSLVRAYNLMVHDLYDSTRQLTQAERDKAWATMARQVAHEIKNPLTPIKLQIQRLIRMKSKGDPAWADRFDEVSREVLGQIDLLADTANEFSTFAKLYTEEPVEIDLDKLLKEEISLFDSRDNIEFSYMGLDNAKVTGPKPQLTRVFTNLINNSIQAIESERELALEEGREPAMGRILVSLRLSTKDGFYDIVFEDNGPGVSDENRAKLFTPNFTTKNNGTGLGLSICRNVVEKCNGEIFYSKSFSLKGACFTVRFPRQQA